jgi:putative DNA primase/helicase
LIEAAAHAMGTYASKVSAELLMARAHSEHPTEIAYLRGLRLAFAAELNEGARWNEARIKEATGDSTLQARVMHGNFFTFTPTHRFVIAANSRPSISTPDQALRSRLRMVPFLQNFAGREDTHLPRTIRGEAAIVLGWLIRGAEAFYEAGELRNCAAVAEQTEEYFEAHSILDHWIEERCMLDPEAFTPTRELYADFRRWKETRGEGVPSETRFGEQLGRHAALQKRRVNSIRGVQGVKLSPTRPDLLGSRNSGY